MTRSQTWKMRDEQRPWGRQESGRSEEQKREPRLLGGTCSHRAQGGAWTVGGLLQPVPRALNSHVLHQLFQVLDFKAWTHNRWDALATFMKRVLILS